ncbi:ATP-binding protein [Actinacidiphila alni]|uniref:ATP-binding protein n=1 Tax=Actinacidiphila alni TaxID=380248 RepID=UPI003452B29C
MGALSSGALPPIVEYEDVAWFRDEPQGARGAAAALGRRIGLGDRRTAELVLAVAELVANMRRHSVEASLVLRVVRTKDVAGVEVLVTDAGPGIADVSDAMRDGVSTGGTLGIGLGAVRRLADTFDIHSRPGLGTVQLARFWPGPRKAPPLAGEPLVGGVTRPISGEEICGDAWLARVDPGGRQDDGDGGSAGAATAPTDPPLPVPGPATAATDWGTLTGVRHGAGTPSRYGRTVRSVGTRSVTIGDGPALLVMLCDGLGHGPMAALAGQSAAQEFRAGSARTPEQIVRELHRALRGTRGAAVAVARIEPESGRVLFCGIGNVTAALVTPDSRTNMLSHPGIVGHQMHQLHTYEYLPQPGAALIMHSDGLNERWVPQDVAAFFPHSPSVMAAGLLRLAGTRRDDAGVVVARGAW